MLHHIVLIKLKEGTSQEQIDDFYGNAAMLEQIPGVISAAAGQNKSSRTNGFEYFLSVKLQEPSFLEGYLGHQKHEEYASKYLRPIRGESIVLDYTE